MRIEDANQLRLLETEPFAGGPARPPQARRTPKAAGGVTLSLFSAPAAQEVMPPPAPIPLAPDVPRDPRLIAIDRVIEETVARQRRLRTPPSNEADPLRDPIPPEETQLPSSNDAPFDVRSFQFRATPRPADRADLVSLLARRLNGHVLRGNRFHAEQEEDVVDGRVEPAGVSIAFSGASARSRWLPIVQEVAREKGLAEPE